MRYELEMITCCPVCGGKLAVRRFMDRHLQVCGNTDCKLSHETGLGWAYGDFRTLKQFASVIKKLADDGNQV